MPDDSGGPRTRTEPPESSDERWKTVQPLPNWRQKQNRPGLLGRYPVLGIVLVVVLAAGAALAIFGAVRSKDKTSAGGAVGGVLQVGVVGLPSLDPADARDPKAVMVVDQLFDTLVRNRGELQPAPGVARSFEANERRRPSPSTFPPGPGSTTAARSRRPTSSSPWSASPARVPTRRWWPNWRR